MSAPLFLVIEGLDGVGKSTQARALAELLGGNTTREPTAAARDTISAERDPHARALLFAADRRRHQRRLGGLLTKRGPTICDRYTLSMLAYQSAAGCDLGWLADLDRGVRVPDLTIFLDLPVSEAAARVAKRDGSAEVQHRVLASYLSGIALLRARGWRIEVVSALGAPAEVTARILEVLGRALLMAGTSIPVDGDAAPG